MPCKYCESFIKTEMLNRPTETMVHVDYPGDASSLNPYDRRFESMWFCADPECGHFICRVFGPMPGSVRIL